MNSHLRTLPLSRLRFWDEFAADIRAKNDFVAPRCMRKFQQGILLNGRLITFSPFDGRLVEAHTSRHLPGGFVCYGFRSVESFWVVSYSIRHGFPLSRVVLTEDRSVFDIESGNEAAAGEDAVLIRHLNLLDASTEWSGNATGPLLLIGHPNFAHHLWNELSGLDEWLKQIEDRVPSIISINCQFEPLGQIEKLFPALEGERVIRGEFVIESRAAGSLITHIGGTLITTSLRQRVIDAMSFVKDNVTSGILEQLSAAGPVIWITVRPLHGGRACLNQVEFLTDLICRLCIEFPESSYIFDGFSTPINYSNSGDFGRLFASFADRISSARQIISTIIDSLRTRLGPLASNSFHDISGLTIGQAIAIAGRASFYVSHAGTIQHKLGWIHNTPGFIHSCQGGITPGARRWYADQVEDGEVPYTITSSLVEDAPMKGDLATRNLDYTIKDVPAAVEEVVQSIYTKLTRPPRY